MKNNFFSYDPKLRLAARKLRNNATFGEVLLWQKLRKKQVKCYDFHRQKPIHHFILDFFCPELMLGIEIDGITHDDKIGYDFWIGEHTPNPSQEGNTPLTPLKSKNSINSLINSRGEHTPNPSQEGNTPL